MCHPSGKCVFSSGAKKKIGVYCWLNSGDCYMVNCDSLQVETLASAIPDEIVENSNADTAKLPKNGAIPDERTAVAVALVIFKPVFDQRHIDKFLPYHAQLKDGVRTVYGTLKQGWRGGTPQLRINKTDGRALEMWHSR